MPRAFAHRIPAVSVSELRARAQEGLSRRETRMTLGTILLIVLILILLGAIPAWPYSRGWGYYPSGTIGVVLVVVLVLLLLGYV